VFAAVVEHQGFAAAQVELNVGQSTISNHITALEQRLGIRLCQRGRAGFRLTEKGARVYQAVVDLLRTLDDFSSETAALRRELVGRIRIGLVDAIITDSNCRISETFAAFNQRSHSVLFEIVQGVPQSLQVKVLSGELDVAVGSFPNRLPGLQMFPLHSESQCLYCGRRHRLFSVPEYKIESAAILREQAVGRAYWRSSHTNNKAFVNTKATVHSIEHQIMLILSGNYVGFLPDHAAHDYVAQGELRALKPDQFTYVTDFHLITKGTSKRSRVVETFLKDLQTSYGITAG